MFIIILKLCVIFHTHLRRILLKSHYQIHGGKEWGKGVFFYHKCLNIYFLCLCMRKGFNYSYVSSQETNDHYSFYARDTKIAQNNVKIWSRLDKSRWRFINKKHSQTLNISLVFLHFDDFINLWIGRNWVWLI